MGLTVDSSELTFLPTSKSRDTKTRLNMKKIWPDQIEILCPSLRIRGLLPAPIVNSGDSFWKWPDFRLWRAHDLDLGSGHTAYHRASLIDLLYMPNFIEIEETFCVCGRTDGRAYVRTFVPLYGRTLETSFIRSTLSKSQPNKYKSQQKLHKRHFGNCVNRLYVQCH